MLRPVLSLAFERRSTPYAGLNASQTQRARLFSGWLVPAFQRYDVPTMIVPAALMWKLSMERVIGLPLPSGVSGSYAQSYWLVPVL